jgi:hypothetical protein
MAAAMARARLKVQLDVSIGDPVTPAPRIIDYPQTLAAQPFTRYGYPLATFIAEKLTTAVALGDFSTRDRDYADLYRLVTLKAPSCPGRSRRPPITVASLCGRSACPSPTSRRRQDSYTAWRLRQATASASYPGSFAVVV